MLENIPNYNLNLTMSLNLGFGIEGTTGSSFKIDISYFSPHINYSRTLENIGQNYEVNLVISHGIVEFMSDQAKEYLRPIECIIVDYKPERNFHI